MERFMRQWLDIKQLKKEIIRATEESFKNLNGLVKDESLYAFCLWMHDEGTYIIPIANTEEGLYRIVREYNKNTGEPIEKLIARLKWYGIGDWVYKECLHEHFKTVADILNQGWNKDYSEYYYDPKQI